MTCASIMGGLPATCVRRALPALSKLPTAEICRRNHKIHSAVSAPVTHTLQVINVVPNPADLTQHTMGDPNPDPVDKYITVCFVTDYVITASLLNMLSPPPTLSSCRCSTWCQT